MEMIDHVSISIEMVIAHNGRNSEMCNELICIDRMCDCYYATYVSNMVII